MDAPCSPFFKPPGSDRGPIHTHTVEVGMDNEIRICRARKDITQGELADAVGVSRQTIISIEKGKYDPSLELAFRLANYFGMSIEDIFHFEDEQRGE